MRRVSRDINHHQIVAALRRAGVAVSDLAAVGGGCPDLFVSYAGKALLVEVKNPATRPTKPRGASNAAKLARQAAFAARHPGHVLTATTADEVLVALGIGTIAP